MQKGSSPEVPLEAALGLPVDSGKPFEVSHSKIKMGRRCLKAYHYRYIRKLQRRVKSRPLIVGSLVHECLEMWFRDGHYMPAITKWKDGEFKKMFVEEQALHSDVVPLAKQLIRGYIKNWESTGLEMVWVEKEFRVEVAPGLFLVGKIDGLAKDNRFRWLVEHKTCKKMPGEEVRVFDTQVVLYFAALTLIGEDEPVQGVIWDYLRTKLPTKPELLARGGLSVAKSIDTTREVYEREIHRHGLDPRGYQDFLETLDAKRDQFYRQVKLPISRPTMAQTVLSELINTARLLQFLERLLESGVDCFSRNLTRDCSWCDYAPLCHAELRGEDTSFLLKHDYILRVKHGDEESREVEVE